VLNNMVFSYFKESIKACGSDNCLINYSFSCLIFLSSFLEILEFLLNFRKSSKSSLSELSSDN